MASNNGRPPKTPLRNYNKQQTQDKILRAARHLFRERGFDGAMMDEIAESAKVSRATLYNYFEKKEAVLIGIANQERAVLEEIVKKEHEKNASPDKIIIELMTDYILDSLEYASLARRITFFLADAKEDEESKILQIILPLVKEAKKAGIFSKSINAKTFAGIIVSVYYFYIYEAKTDGKINAVAKRQDVRRTLELVLKAASSGNIITP